MATIDSTTNKTQLAIRNTSIKPVEKTKNTVEPRQAEAVQNETRLKDRIAYWFARAGVSPKHEGGMPTDVNKKLVRRKQIIEQKKLANLETIMELATEYCPDAGSTDNLDPDWFFSFIQLAEDIHSPLMQELWGKIFAVEIAKAGSFSLRTLQMLKQITQRDAAIFKKAAGLASHQKNHVSPKIIIGFYQKPSIWNFFSSGKNKQLNLGEFGLSYPEILSLIEMNLLYASEIESAELDPNTRVEWNLGKEAFYLAPKGAGFALNYYKFTPMGVELMKLINPSANISYLERFKALCAVSFEVR